MRIDGDPLDAATFHQRVQRLIREHGKRDEPEPGRGYTAQLLVGPLVISERVTKGGDYGINVHNRAWDTHVYSYSNERGRSEIRFTASAVRDAREILDREFVLDSLSSI